MKPDAVLGVGVIEDGDAVAIGHLDNLAGEGVGEGCYGENYEDAKGNNTGRQMHFLIPGIPGFTSVTGDIVVR